MDTTNSFNVESQQFLNFIDQVQSTENLISYRMANTDNQLQMNSIVELFKMSYGDSFPRKAVYDQRFWTQHVGRRFASILIYVGDELAGHIALQRDKTNPNHVELGLPAFLNKYLHLSEQISILITNICEKTAKRQNWEMLYSFIYRDCQSLHCLSNECLKMNVTLLCPEYLNAILENGDRLHGNSIHSQHVMIGVRHFNNEKKLPFIQTDNQRNTDLEALETILYVPKQHRKICEYLYQPLGIRRIFSDKSKSSLEEALPADGRAIETNYFSRAGILNTFLTPSLLKGSKQTLRSILDQKVRSHFIFVNMLDSQCPETCNMLEKNSFRFCGVFPLLKDKESIVYFKDSGSDLGINTLPTKQAKVLAHYIENYDLETSLVKSNELVDQAKILRTGNSSDLNVM